MRGVRSAFGEAEFYFVAATSVFFLLAGLLLLVPSFALFGQRRRALKDQPVRVVSKISPEVVRIRLKPKETKIGFYDLEPNQPVSMPQVCSCCCSDDELSIVKEGIAYRRFKLNSKGQPYFYYLHTRYLDFDVPYCRKCLLHVKLGGLAPLLAILASALMFPAIDFLFVGLTGRKLVSSSVSIPVFYCERR